MSNSLLKKSFLLECQRIGEICLMTYSQSQNVSKWFQHNTGNLQSHFEDSFHYGCVHYVRVLWWAIPPRPRGKWDFCRSHRNTLLSLGILELGHQVAFQFQNYHPNHYWSDLKWNSWFFCHLQINSAYAILSLHSLIASSLPSINNQLLTYMHLENINLMKWFLVILCYIHRSVSGPLF